MSDPLTALMHAVQVMNLLKTLILRTLREREEAEMEGYSSFSRSPSSDEEGGDDLDSEEEADMTSELGRTPENEMAHGRYFEEDEEAASGEFRRDCDSLREDGEQASDDVHSGADNAFSREEEVEQRFLRLLELQGEEATADDDSGKEPVSSDLNAISGISLSASKEGGSSSSSSEGEEDEEEEQDASAWGARSSTTDGFSGERRSPIKQLGGELQRDESPAN